MLSIECSGSPYEIGLTHGRSAKLQISRTISFYSAQFQENCSMDWPTVQQSALQFEPVIKSKWPAYLEEMQGLAAGSERELSDIIAINVRTEITFGCFTDGCTALSYLTPSNNKSYLAQNWDWDVRQKENIVQLTILQRDKPTIKMMTEAGLIGKIGLNSAGVGVCLNAIKAKGMDPTRIPCHLGLRMALESRSMDEAVRKLEKYGVASACHMLVADPKGSVGLEWSAYDLGKVEMNEKKQVFHSNHYLLPHPKAPEAEGWLKDSGTRIRRIEELTKKLGEEPSAEEVVDVFKDEQNWPGAICRKECKGIETLFNIVMELKGKRAKVTMGRPVEADEAFELNLD